MIWIAIALVATLCAVALAAPFFTGGARAPGRAAHDVEALKAQLREVDLDLARGTLTEDEADAARIHVSRRLLTADAAALEETGSRPAPRGAALGVGVVLALAIPGAAVWLYDDIGQPGVPDLPLSSRAPAGPSTLERPSQIAAEGLTRQRTPAEPPDPEYVTLIRELEARLGDAPDDPNGLQLLANAKVRLGEYRKARQLYERLIEIDPDGNTSERYATYTEVMVFAAGGYISPQAELAAEEALSLSPQNAAARHFLALAQAQRGNMRGAISGWIALLRDNPQGGTWQNTVLVDLRRAADEIGADLPGDIRVMIQDMPGPNADDVTAAADMSATERAAMVDGMVAGLAARLEENPDNLEGWLRLIRAYRVLGRDTDAEDALRAARETFADDAAAQSRLDGA